MPFVLNGVMQLAKWTGGLQGTAGKRFVLALFAIAGVIATSNLTGMQIDVNSISSLTQTALEALVAFFAAHGTYSMLFNAKPSPEPALDLEA